MPELPWAVAVSTLAKGQRAAPQEERHCHLHTQHSPAQPGLLHPLAECLAGPPCPRSIRLLGTNTLTENDPVPRLPLALLPGTCTGHLFPGSRARDTQAGGKAKPRNAAISLSPAARALPTGICPAEQHAPSQTGPELLLLILHVYQNLNYPRKPPTIYFISSLLTLLVHRVRLHGRLQANLCEDHTVLLSQRARVCVDLIREINYHLHCLGAPGKQL